MTSLSLLSLTILKISIMMVQGDDASYPINKVGEETKF